MVDRELEAACRLPDAAELGEFAQAQVSHAETNLWALLVTISHQKALRWRLRVLAMSG